MTRRFLALSLTVILAGLAGCSPVEPEGDQPATQGDTSTGTAADPSEVKTGGTLTVALVEDPDKLDPTLARSLVSRHVFNAMCQKLYDVDKDAKIVPQLATALPTISPDGLTVTIPLREGVRFADGGALDSAAVKTTLNRHLTLKGSGRKTELGPISSIETPDPKTVVVKLSKPFAPLTAALSDRAGMIMSPAAITKLGANFATGPVCSGPFKFVRRVAQNSISLVKDPQYYDANKVFLDAIEFRIITDSTIRAANVRSGDAQVAERVSTQDAPGLQKDTSLTVLQSQSLGYQGITVNVGNVDGVGEPAKPIDRPIAKDPRVREALEASIDRETLVKTIFNGLNNVACSPISPLSEFSSDAAQACPPHDPAKAKKLLADAGVTTPYKVTLLTQNNPDDLRLAQAIQAMAKDGGFDIVLQPTEFTALLDQQDRGDFELLRLGWSGRVDPDANIFNFVGSGGGQNVAGYNDADLDALLTEARQTLDKAKRTELYGKVVTRLQEKDPLIYLYRQRNITAVTNKVKGVQVFPDGVVRAAFAGHSQ